MTDLFTYIKTIHLDTLVEYSATFRVRHTECNDLHRLVNQ